MQITYNKSDNHNDFFTLTDDSKQEYLWHTRKGNFNNLDADHVLLLIRKREWPEATKDRDYVVDEGQTELEAIEEWITSSAMLRDDEGEFAEKAEKVAFKGTHPEPSRIIDGEKISDATLKELENATTISALKAVFKKIIQGS